MVFEVRLSRYACGIVEYCTYIQHSVRKLANQSPTSYPRSWARAYPGTYWLPIVIVTFESAERNLCSQRSAARVKCRARARYRNIFENISVHFRASCWIQGGSVSLCTGIVFSLFPAGGGAGEADASKKNRHTEALAPHPT